MIDGDRAVPVSGGVEATVDALCELRRQRAIEYSIAVGRIVVEGIYDGDLAQLRGRQKDDCPSLRALAAHPRMPLNATALHQAIGIYELSRRMPGVIDAGLTVTHLRAVLPLDDDAQDQLLSRAVADGWSTTRLAREARSLRPPRSKGGRPRLPRVVKTLNRINRLTDDNAAWADLEAVEEMSFEKRRQLKAKVARLEQRLRGVKLRLTHADELAEQGFSWRVAPGRLMGEAAALLDDEDAPSRREDREER